MHRIEPFSPAHVSGVVTLCAAEGWPSWTLDSVERAFSAPGVEALVAIDGDEVVGAAQLVTDGVVIAYLGMIVVASKARRRGIGRSLIGELVARTGVSRVDLLTEARAVPFYESFSHRPKRGYRLYVDTTD